MNWVENGIIVLQTCRVNEIDLVIYVLECWEVWIDPQLFGVEDPPDDVADKIVSEVGADVRREVLDPWIDLLLVDDLGELVDRTGIVDLDLYYKKEKTNGKTLDARSSLPVSTLAKANQGWKIVQILEKLRCRQLTTRRKLCRRPERF